MKRREFFRALGGAVAATVVPAAAFAAPSTTFDVVSTWAEILEQVAKHVVGQPEDNWHFQIRWKRIAKAVREQGIQLDYSWRRQFGAEAPIDDLRWTIGDRSYCCYRRGETPPRVGSFPPEFWKNRQAYFVPSH